MVFYYFLISFIRVICRSSERYIGYRTPSHPRTSQIAIIIVRVL